MPLTQLASMVNAVPGNEEGDVDFIRRNRYRWSRFGFLDLSKVLWDQ
ncbi:MAG: hypothetical protein K1X78_09695 [Verrucomicrobiaceae bacterium]|nr:hypothetical protein [Verrucomicrobiaceae bacterium]